MEMRGLLTTAADVTRFMSAGNATITLESQATGKHFTFRIKKAKDSPKTFVQVLTGPSNEENFTYLGMLLPNSFEGLFITKRSKFNRSSPPAAAFMFMCRGLSKGSIPDKLQVYHEGRCGRCGRKLTVPESITSGYGPECIDKVGGA
mgnify:CR=1 FL=1